MKHHHWRLRIEKAWTLFLLLFRTRPFPGNNIKYRNLTENSSCSSSSTVVDSPESKWTSLTRSTITSFRLKFNTHWECRDSTISFSVQIYYTSSPPKGPFCTDGANRYTEFSGWLAYWKESRVIHRRTTLANKSQSTNWHEISINTHSIGNWTINSTINWHWIGLENFLRMIWLFDKIQIFGDSFLLQWNKSIFV